MKSELSCSEITKLKLAASLKELMNDNSFEKITVADITNNCGMHRQTFYYHFQDRYELLDWLLYQELIEPFTADFTLDNMYIKFHNLLTTMNEDKAFYQSAMKINFSDLANYISKVSSEQFVQIINQIGKYSGISSDKENELILAEFFGYGLSGVVVSWIRNGMKESPTEMTSHLRSMTSACKQILEIRKG